jgi:CcmD family protein
MNNFWDLKNFWNLFAAYSIIFAAIFIYTWLIGVRQKRLDRKIDELQEQLKDDRSSRLKEPQGAIKKM